jgi:hypothetical protein
MLRCAPVGAARQGERAIDPGAARRRLLPALLVAALVAELLREAWRPGPQLDDAYISYRYARNLVDGLGLVYNAGERVEGFTNLLWTLLVAGGVALGLDAPVVGHALGLASAAGLLVATAAYTATGLARERQLAAPVAAALVLVAPAFRHWATLGMETPLFALLVTAGLAAHARGRIGAAAAFASLATLTRPEGAVLAAVVFAAELAAAWRRGGPAALGRALRWPLAYASLLAALTIFRLAYYGAPLPNTFYAKVGGLPWESGLLYVGRFLVEGAWLLLVPAWLGARRVPALRPGAAAAGAFALAAVLVGGDVFAHSRFLLPALPPLAALAARGAAAAAARDPRLGALAWASLAAAIPWSLFGLYALRIETCAVLLAAGFAAAASLGRGRPAPGWIAACAAALALRLFVGLPEALDRLPERSGRRTRAEALADDLRGHANLERLARRRAGVLQARGEPVRLVATAGIGAFGWFSGLPILDVFGLVDPTIARSEAPAGEDPAAWFAPGHQRSAADYVFSREPDYLLIPQRGSIGFVAPATLALWDHPALAADYAWDAEVVGYRRTAAR